MQYPYPHETPVPIYFRLAGWLDNHEDATIIFFCFAQCSPVETVIEHGRKLITLAPYEFMLSRAKFGKACGVHEDKIRRRVETWIKMGLLEKTKNHSSGTFSFLRWKIERFIPYTPPNQN